MLAVSPTATELPSSAEKLGVIEQVRSPTVMEAGETPVTVPVFCADGTPVVVALVVTVVVPPDVEVAEEEEDEDTEEDDDENEEEDEEAADDETLTDPALPGAPEDEMLVGCGGGLDRPQYALPARDHRELPRGKVGHRDMRADPAREVTDRDPGRTDHRDPACRKLC